MKTYLAHFAHTYTAYAKVEITAKTNKAAIEQAKAMLAEWPETRLADAYEVDYGSGEYYRIVGVDHVVREGVEREIFAGATLEEIEEEIDARSQEAAEERAERSEPEDTPHLQSGRDNCDDWGTGEGAYHGRIG